MTKSYETAGLAPQRSSGLRGPVAGAYAVCHGTAPGFSRYEVGALKKKLGARCEARGLERTGAIRLIIPHRAAQSDRNPTTLHPCKTRTSGECDVSPLVEQLSAPSASETDQAPRLTADAWQEKERGQRCR